MVSNAMPRPRLADQHEYMTSTDVCKKLGITEHQLRVRLTQGIFPPPTMVDGYQGVRYFDEDWLRKVREIMSSWEKKRG
ncbi:MAG: MerR family transcriptional regulator [Desulfobacterales bacterium]|nr:MerR family transcriptional regulator [Desulfobacterales bacterium]